VDLARSAVEVEIEAASIDGGVADRDTHLRSADFLDAEKFPTLRYRSEIEAIHRTCFERGLTAPGTRPRRAAPARPARTRRG
jgi:hypothetical protein